MGNQRINPVLKEIAGIFGAHKKQVYLVGGAVRDLLLGCYPNDWDIATDARPEEVMAMFAKVIPTGIKHGTVTIRFKGHSIESTTFRTESDYTDGRRPDTVRYAATIEEDLSRRDFTMNAIALRLPAGDTVDPYHGREDIMRRLIRCVGNPGERFCEDGLRPVRAVRFAAQLGFDIEDATLAAIPGALPVTERVAPERIKDELSRIVTSRKPSTAFLAMERTGLLQLLLPELAACRNIDQKGFHRFDVLGHSLLACDFAANDPRGIAAKNFCGDDGENQRLEVCLAALFHDLGKPVTRKLDERNIWTFHQHERESAELAKNILLRLRYPNTVIDTVVHLIRQHMFHYDESWSDAAVRRFIIRVGEPYLDALYALRRADAFATAGTELPADFLCPLISRVDRILSEGKALSLKDLAVNGNDLIRLGVQPGKRIGIILNELLEAVLDDPDLNTAERLSEIAGNINRRYGG
ncbi:CCA tRNA nucleotidyltransferase [Breznakiella homolactica]|uniref:HD domain-containing protein n=1 Tax=Breznakiella homolactica TaxID=2798577 RepID=A0A7T8BB40_9SPIR|nr:HD domain-containing protein [Breznakiella homolactica]QQO11404.1 HD domain-containing protein [Breznakiella homolactica]